MILDFILRVERILRSAALGAICCSQQSSRLQCAITVTMHTDDHWHELPVGHDDMQLAVVIPVPMAERCIWAP
jgi:hypothetical protein